MPFQLVPPDGGKGVHYTYVLRSEADGRFYSGATDDLRARVAAHEKGRVRSTSYRRPLRLVYYEACLHADDAYRRERYVKSGRGGRYVRQRLLRWLSEVRGDKLERY